MRDRVPSRRYSSVCNVLRQWNIPLIPTYRVYRLYDIIESVDSISRDEPDSPLTHYITNGISHARYTITLFKHNHRVLRLISNRRSVYITSLYSASLRTRRAK